MKKMENKLILNKNNQVHQIEDHKKKHHSIFDKLKENIQKSRKETQHLAKGQLENKKSIFKQKFNLIPSNNDNKLLNSIEETEEKLFDNSSIIKTLHVVISILILISLSFSLIDNSLTYDTFEKYFQTYNQTNLSSNVGI